MVVKLPDVLTPDIGIDVGKDQGDGDLGAFGEAVGPAGNLTFEGLRGDMVGDRDGRGEASDFEDVPQDFVLVLQVQGVPNGPGIDLKIAVLDPRGAEPGQHARALNASNSDDA